jgi:acetyl esterase/lipase
MKTYEDSLYQKLRQDRTMEEVYGIKVNVKKIPDLDEAGYLDPRQLEIIKKDQAKKKIIDSNISIIEQIRRSMGYPNLNLNTIEIYTKYEEHNFNGNIVKFWIYTPRKPEGKKDRPCFIYLHGGGWVGGTPYVVENPCKLISERADAVVVNVDYALAPEHPFPNGFQDCYNTVKYVYDNAEKYGIDKNKIGIGGDSAGGNLAAVCTLKDMQEGTNMIKYEALIYPVVTFELVEGLQWDINEYNIHPSQEAIITPNLNLGRRDKDGQRDYLEEIYLEHADPQSDMISPMLAKSHKGLPKTLIAVAEYDGLRLQAEYYAKILTNEAVDVRVIRYNGICHAFIDKLGVLPQAEDLIQEISNDLLSL